ncbi:unnamed protein product, partial [Brenthis ino]
MYSFIRIIRAPAHLAACLRQPVEHMTAYRTPRTRQPWLLYCGCHQNAPDCTAARWLRAARASVGECMWLSSVSAHLAVAARCITICKE